MNINVPALELRLFATWRIVTSRLVPNKNIHYIRFSPEL